MVRCVGMRNMSVNMFEWRICATSLGVLPGLSMKSHCPRPAISMRLRKRTVGVMLDSRMRGEFSVGSSMSSGYRQKHLPERHEIKFEKIYSFGIDREDSANFSKSQPTYLALLLIHYGTI